MKPKSIHFLLGLFLKYPWTESIFNRGNRLIFPMNSHWFDIQNVAIFFFFCLNRVGVILDKVVGLSEIVHNQVQWTEMLKDATDSISVRDIRIGSWHWHDHVNIDSHRNICCLVMPDIEAFSKLNSQMSLFHIRFCAIKHHAIFMLSLFLQFWNDSFVESWSHRINNLQKKNNTHESIGRHRLKLVKRTCRKRHFNEFANGIDNRARTHTIHKLLIAK